MLSSRFRPWHIPVFLAKYSYLAATRRPILVHFEVTLRCNAKCGFCDYWKTDKSAKATEVKGFADAARYFNPMMITFTGGEPTLRSDLEEIVAGVHSAVKVKYITLLSHGGMMTVDRAQSLWAAGVHQFNFSLDYLDQRHDDARGIPGLSRKIFRTVSAMRDSGIDAIRFNTVIKRSNLNDIVSIVDKARELGCGVNFSSYTANKNGNDSDVIGPNDYAQLQEVIDELLDIKKRKRGLITNSDYYLRQLPKYVRGETSTPCRSGIRTIHVTPTGGVKRCPDFPEDFQWQDYKRYKPVNCNACYYACRGESEAPMRLSRIQDVLA
ncbi:MAG: radical SAM protein [Gemmatimonadaceae bacterium]|nr:radical SAM protein [Gemmatimonadaceae bacterium]